MDNDKTYRDRVVRIHELVPQIGPAILDGFTFQGCQILGPAVLFVMSGLTLSESEFGGGSIDEIFWLTPPEGGKAGMVGVTHTAFLQCRFQQIGWAGGPEVRAQFAGNTEQ